MTPNQRLKDARLAAGWTQEEVADLLAVSATTVYRWERGETTPTTSLRARLCRLFRRSAVELGLDEAPLSRWPKEQAPFLVDPALPASYQPPLGQGALLKHLVSAPQTVLGVVGLPGAGKTALVSALAHHQDLHQHVDGVLWASCGQHPEPLRHLCRWLAFLGEGEAARVATIEEAHDRLHLLLRGRIMLLMLDDLWRAEDVLPFRPGGDCRLLLTTRLPVVANTLCERIIHPQPLSDAQALQFVSAGLPATMVREHRPVLAALCKQMGNLPLALEHSRTYLRREARTHSVRRLYDALSHLFQPEVYLPLCSAPDVCSLAVALKQSETWLDASARRTLHRLATCFPAAPATFTEQQIVDRLAPGAVLRDLDQLIDIGLLTLLADNRYQMHPIVATYARCAESSERDALGAS
jgi:transcriptional regulator with XRE-family HTH domain